MANGVHFPALCSMSLVGAVKSYIFPSSVVIGIAAILFFEHRGFEAREAADASKWAELSSQIAILEAREIPTVHVVHERIVEQSHAAPSVISGPSTVEDIGATDAGLVDDPVQARMDRVDHQRAEEFARFQTAFEAEPRNTDWGRREENEFSRVIRQTAAQPHALKSLECRSQTCRMDVSFDSVALSNQFIDALFGGPNALIKHRGVTIPLAGPEDDGRYHATLFVASPGSE